MNIKSIAIGLLSCIWLVISIEHSFRYPDTSNFIIFVFIGLAGLYFAYDQWYKDYYTQKVKSIEMRIDSLVYSNRDERRINQK